jgi:hypothetical protein
MVQVRGMMVSGVHFSKPWLDGWKGIWAYGDNAIHGGIGLIALDRFLVVVKDKTASSLNQEEACGDIPFILWADIDDAVDLSRSYKS